MAVPPDMEGRAEYLEIDRDRITILSNATIGPYRTRVLDKKSEGDGLKVGVVEVAQGYSIRYEVRRGEDTWTTSCRGVSDTGLECTIDASQGGQWMWTLDKDLDQPGYVTGRLRSEDASIALDDGVFRKSGQTVCAVEREEMWIANDVAPPTHAVLVSAAYGLWAVGEWIASRPDDT